VNDSIMLDPASFGLASRADCAGYFIGGLGALEPSPRTAADDDNETTTTTPAQREQNMAPSSATPCRAFT